jgi:hypothetical protein
MTKNSLSKIETDQYMEAGDIDKIDKENFSKLSGPGDKLRKMAASSFLINPDEARKLLRKKKGKKSKAKRKTKGCECK